MVSGAEAADLVRLDVIEGGARSAGITVNGSQSCAMTAVAFTAPASLFCAPKYSQHGLKVDSAGAQVLGADRAAPSGARPPDPHAAS